MKTMTRKVTQAISIGLTLMAFTACNDDDEQTPINEPMPETATLEVMDQTISQNMVMVTMANVPQNGFIVIHKDNGNNGPVVPDIVSEPVFIEKGNNENVMVPLSKDAQFTDGEKLWVMLHMDSGTPQVYEFDGANGLDGPFTADDNIIMAPLNIESASLSVMNQPVMNGTVTIPEVKAAADGWLVVHNDDGTGNIVLPGIIGKTMVSKGITQNVEVMLDTTKTYTAGQKLFPMLHLDNGIIGQYEFDGVGEFDGPEIFGNDPFPGNVIFTSFEVN